MKRPLATTVVILAGAAGILRAIRAGAGKLADLLEVLNDIEWND